MISEERSINHKPILKLDFTVHDLMESLSEFQLKKTVITKMSLKITTRDFPSSYISLVPPPTYHQRMFFQEI